MSSSEAVSEETTQAVGGWWTRLRLAHIWLAVPLLVTFIYLGIGQIETFDFWWNAKSGQIMAQSGQILLNDVLVYSPVRLPYYNPQWGAQLILYWLYSASPLLLLLARCLIFTAVNAIVMYHAVRRSAAPRTAALVTLLVFAVSITNYGIRPQMLAFLPFALFYLILFGLPYKQHREADLLPGPYIGWPIFALPLLMLYWVNVHGSFFIGGGLVAIYVIGTLWRTLPSAAGRIWLRSREAMRQAIALLLTAAAIFVNPYGFDIINYFFVATNDPVARALNVEWQPPSIYDGGTGVMFYASLFILFVSVYVGRRRWNVYDTLLTITYVLLGLISLRNVIWWGLVLAPIITANFAAYFERRADADANKAQNETLGDTIERPALNWAALLLVIALALVFNPIWRIGNPLLNDDLQKVYDDIRPQHLADYLQQREAAGTLNGRIFNYMEWGGYLEWKLYPQQQMFIDGRFEARQVQVWDDYIHISKGYAPWQDLLNQPQYGDIRFLVLSDGYQKDLLPLVNASANWKLVWPAPNTPDDQLDGKNARGYVYERVK